MISEIWTFINDIEDCSPYFPIGIGSPSQYIGNRKKSFEPAVANEDSPPASYQQLRRELDCFSINWTTRYSLLCNPSLIYKCLCAGETPPSVAAAFLSSTRSPWRTARSAGSSAASAVSTGGRLCRATFWPERRKTRKRRFGATQCAGSVTRTGTSRLDVSHQCSMWFLSLLRYSWWEDDPRTRLEWRPWPHQTGQFNSSLLTAGCSFRAPFLPFFQNIFSPPRPPPQQILLVLCKL